MKMLLSLIVLLTSLSLASAQSVDVAKVDYSRVGDLLEAVVLSQPENKELGERFKAIKAKEKEIQTKMQESIMKGEKINPMEAAAGMLVESRAEEKVEVLCEKHLLEVIEKTVGDKYEIVLKSSYQSSLLFTKVPIDDVTDLVRQELLRQLPKDDKRFSE